MAEITPGSAESDAPRWHPGWRIGHRRWDWLRSTRCLLTGHRWEVNYHETQRVCHGCHTAQDRLPDQWRTPVCRHGHASRQECCTCCGWATRGGIACCGTCPTPPAAPLPLHRTEAGYPNCSTCDGGGCLDCTDPA